MSTSDNLEQLESFTTDDGLPKADMALFGARCPYCGKTDRIQSLAPSDDLSRSMVSEAVEFYIGYWKHFTGAAGSLSVCNFLLKSFTAVEERASQTVVPLIMPSIKT